MFRFIWGGAGRGNTVGTHLPARAQSPDCDTPVSPYLLDETWTAAHSPNCVTSDVFVLGLTIGSGVTGQACGDFVFEVAGQLQVESASHTPARFTPHDLTIGWRSTRLHYAGPGSCPAHVIIKGVV